MELNPLFIDMMSSYGDSPLSGIVDALQSTTPAVSIRLNRHKDFEPHRDWERVPWAERGYYLPSRPQFTLDPMLHQGRYYVQEASSMVAGEIVSRLVAGSDAPLRYLDACV